MEGSLKDQSLPESVYQFVLDALQEGKAVAVMGIEGGAVEFSQVADLLHRDLVDRLLLQDLQERFLQDPLGITHPCVRLLHVDCPRPHFQSFSK